MKGLYLLLLIPLALNPLQVYARSADIGFGFGFVDAAAGDGFEGGWDVQVGYEFKRKAGWDIGAQLHLIRGLTARSGVTEETDMAFSSNALYLSARPMDWWLYFKGGAVQAQYKTLTMEQSDVGVGLGAGVTMRAGSFRFHLLDYQRFMFGADSFNVYTVSFAMLLQ